MKRIVAALFLLASPLFTQPSFISSEPKPRHWTPPSETKEWKMTFSSGVGYRNDSQIFKEALYTSYLRNFNSVQLATNLVFSWDRLILKLAADYGWLVNGNLDFKGFTDPFASPFESFPTFKMGSGYTADIQPAIACRIKFWTFSCGCGSLSFIPALGYNYSHFNAYPEQQRQYSPVGTNGFTNLAFTKPIQQDWFGPVVEGRIAFSWNERWRIDWTYQYMHIDFRQTQEFAVANFFYNDSGDPTEADTTLLKLSSKGNTLRTQLGGVDISYRSPNQWQVGSHFEGSSTWSHTARTIVKQTKDSFVPMHVQSNTKSTETLKVNWTRYSVNFYGAYWF